VKEADIQFGEWYAVKNDDGDIVREKVLSKVPVQPGKTRSRMYILEHAYLEPRVDASKIMMPWSQYEQTDEYARDHVSKLGHTLDHEVAKAVTDWNFSFLQFLSQITGSEQVPRAPHYRVYSSASVDEFFERILSTTVVTLSAKKLMALADIPVPPAHNVQALIEQRNEVLRQSYGQLLPRLAAATEASIDAYENGPPLTVLDDKPLSEFVDALRVTGDSTPHPTLIRVAQTFPSWHFVAALASESQFSYLLRYLTDS
jgi:hypothetical protein